MCIVGEGTADPKKCTLITFNTNREERVVAEVEYLWGVRWDASMVSV